MKKIYIVLFISLIMNGISCSDYLDYQPDDFLTMDKVFSDKIRTEDWLASVYSSVPSPMWGYYKDQGFNIMGDDITIPHEWRDFGWKNVYDYTTANWNPNSGWNPYYWVELPKRIRTGLVFLQNVRIIPEAGLTQEYVDQMKNEVRFLIAYYYSLMIELYGPIPFAPGVIYDVNASTEELMIGQTPYDEIVDWIDQELKGISEKLPAIYSNSNDWGRVTSIMALAVRARMLLFAASPLFNGNPDLADWKNADGVNLFKPEYDAQKWMRAATAHKELIDAAHKAGYELYKEYNSDGSIDPFMSYYNMSLKTINSGNKEIIFVRPVDGGDMNWWQAHHLPKGIRGNAAMGVTQELVDAFHMKNGIVPVLGYNPDGSPIIDPQSGYVEKGFSSQAEMRHTQWPGGGPRSMADRNTGMSPVTLDGTYNMYCNREPRFYVSVIFNEEWLGVANRRVDFLKGGADTGPTFDSPQNGYNIRKRISLDVDPLNNKYTANQPGILYRLAEAYLGYAEAVNESQGPNEEVYKYVNMVRERAGIPNLKAGLSKEEMRNAIQHERRVEFNCEGIRFNDVRRWKQGEKYLNVSLYGMNKNGTKKSDDSSDQAAFYKRTFYKNRYFNKKMYLWPVPQSQMDINPNLRQAPGY
ncbi:RagB/SusD family nutrient uptake outer membrane protein [Proteiniphilum sp. X52]|uniref:RagB/SusD family nutrient uptake outer membrane protein n=1 Tax=Proteiniphilum sp. X52 TaxID=2382159 RepID=UPI000F0A362D|nr:RagB/SusD family nutrient uptake outer membrane protein [Proteiniphilum sp. X52]RNC66589.1 RagB/SusD family nutrient uptake outer membrane protein [Proteiniphilum sp. X52]